MAEPSYFRHLLTQAMAPQAAIAREEGAAFTTGAPQVVVADDVYVYRVADDVLAHGSSFGNARAWATSKGTGVLEELFSIDLGRIVAGSFDLGYFVRYRDVTAEEGGDAHRHDLCPDHLVRLPPVGRGSYLLHPAYQQHHYILTGQLEVLETFFLPRAGDGSDPCAVYFVSEICNHSPMPIPLLINASLDPSGAGAIPFEGNYRPSDGLLLWPQQEPEHVRLFTSAPLPAAYLASDDLDLISNPLDLFTSAVHPSERIYAALQHQLLLPPGETWQTAYLLLFHPQGAEAAWQQYRRLPAADEVLRRTVKTYRQQLLMADIMTPDTHINQGVQWCKANMLRVLATYPTGKGVTNDPGHSSHVVARDTAWYVYGSDAFLPDASCAMLYQFARLQQDSGKILEYYDARTGQGEDYGLNINDNTPLFALAVAHHLQHTGHLICRQRLLPAACRAIDYFLSQRDGRGLVYCTADAAGEHGICGWRNVMTGERISGAVTEVNSECYAALLAIAALLEEEDAGRAQAYQHAAGCLRDAINRHLLSPQTGMYYLTLDVNGRPRTEITADLVFPLMFGVAEPEINQMISARLNRTDMMTPGGLRTVPTTSLHYHPDRRVGLTGGVWPGVAWWYAMGSAQVDPRLMVRTLAVSYRQFLRDPKIYGTVPGQFSEWFDGESLINRGMRLSPWEPPRFLWAMLEGAYGITPAQEGLAVHLRVPQEWTWCLLRDYPFRGRRYSWFMGRVAGTETFFTATPFATTETLEIFQEEITANVQLLGEHATVMAWRRDGELLIAVATEAGEKVPVPVTIARSLLEPGLQYAVRTYRSETGRWSQIRPLSAAQPQIALWLEAGGFALMALTPLR